MMATSLITIIAVMCPIVLFFIGVIILAYWLLIGSKLPPNVQKLKERRNIPGLIKALDYLNLSRDFWNVRNAAVKALGELSAQLESTELRSQAVEALIATLQGKNKGIDVNKVSVYPLSEVIGSKISWTTYSAFRGRLLKVRELAAETLGQVGVQIQDTTVRTRIIEALIQVLSTKEDFLEDLRRIAAKSLQAITGQDFGVDAKQWTTWWQEYRAPVEQS